MPDRYRPLARTLALLWTLGLLAGLSIPGEELPDLDLFSQDKLLHLGAFFGLGVLWHRAYPRATLRIFVGGVLFGFLTEVYQHVMPIDRLFSLYDALADAVGLALGLAVGVWWHRRRTRARGTGAAEQLSAAPAVLEEKARKGTPKPLRHP